MRVPPRRDKLRSRHRRGERANKLPAKFAMFRLVGIPGFEPGLNPPEGLVLPLHYIPKISAGERAQYNTVIFARYNISSQTFFKILTTFELFLNFLTKSTSSSD